MPKTKITWEDEDKPELVTQQSAAVVSGDESSPETSSKLQSSAAIRLTFDKQKAQVLNALNTLEQQVLAQIVNQDFVGPAMLEVPSTFSIDSATSKPSSTREMMTPVATDKSIVTNKSIATTDKSVFLRMSSANAFTLDKAEEFKILTDTETPWNTFNTKLRKTVTMKSLDQFHIIPWLKSQNFGILPEYIRAPMQQFLDHQVWTTLVTCCIVANAVVMACDSDDFIKRAIKAWKEWANDSTNSFQIEDPPGMFSTMDWFFAGLFSAELLIRVLVYEVQFAVGPEASWNWLDAFFVFITWFEVLQSSGNSGSVPLRLVRILRVARSVRVIRSLRFFKELRLVLLSLVHAAKPLVWSFLSLVLIMFMFSNMFLQLFALSLASSVPDSASTWPNVLINIFPSFMDSMVSLLSLVTGGITWDRPWHAFQKCNMFAAIMVLVYIVCVVLGVLNVIGAVFVEVAMSKAKQDQHLTLMEEFGARKDIANELVQVFHRIDVNKSGSICFQTWEEFLDTEAGKEFLLLFSVDSSQARRLFDLLDNDGNGEIVIDEFVMGFLSFSGSVNKFDLEFISQRNKRIAQKVMDMIQHVQSESNYWQAVLLRLGMIDEHLLLLSNGDRKKIPNGDLLITPQAKLGSKQQLQRDYLPARDGDVQDPAEDSDT